VDGQDGLGRGRFGQMPRDPREGPQGRVRDGPALGLFGMIARQVPGETSIADDV
jgi:hypothetical protein